ncbi:MAG: alpha-amylase family glycosyl hydrolase [Candidatus Limiplasma sp.]|nr:alpha-amylase family glycosyl hydrolase [Candidatus Limiplasma sp.]
MKKMLSLLCALCLSPTLAAHAQAQPRDYYEIFVASYYDADADGCGDLRGIAQKLPELMDLGISGLWLMPVHPSPSYHKYDVTDYYAIDPAYGTLEDFRALGAALRERDIALLLDLVVNHTSSQHLWFQKALAGEQPYRDYYHFFNEPGAGRHALPDGTYYEGVFSPDMPDLNLANPAVFEEVASIADFWLRQGATGFRLDAVLHYEENDAAFNNAFVKKLKERFPQAYFVGEVWADAGTVTRYYESGIDSLLNYPFATQDGAIVKAIKAGSGAGLAGKIAAWQETVRSVNPAALDAPFLSGHDNGRSAGYFVQNLGQQKLAAAVYLFMPGCPFLYYGEELGMTGSGRDENKRLPYLWSATDSTGMTKPPVQADQAQRLIQGYAQQREDPDSLLSAYRALLKAKKRHPALYTGRVTALDLGSPALCAYTASQGEDSVTVVHNFAGEETAFSWEGGGYTLGPYRTMLLSGGAKEVF